MTASVVETAEVSIEQDSFYMAGTEGTGEYQVLAISSFGRVGYRLLSGYLVPDSRVRIRLEPKTKRHAAKIAELLTRELGWKQPGDQEQNRFSIVLPKGDRALEALKQAFALIKRGRPLEYNPNPPDYRADLAL